MASYDLNVSGTVNRTSIMDPAVQAATEVRYGRVRMQNAHGSEMLGLSIPTVVEYYNGSAWQRNVEDNATTLMLTGSTCGGGSPVNSCNWGTLTVARIRPATLAASVTSPSLRDGNTALAGFQPGSANFGLKLSAPGAGNAGSLRITAAVPNYLRFNWSNGSTNTDNPSAVATFGISKTNFIFLRESY